MNHNALSPLATRFPAVTPIAAPAMRTSAKVAFQCAFHVVWCTEYRAPVLDTDIAERLTDVIIEVVEQREAWLAEVDVHPAHVHLVVEVSPQLGIHRLVKAVKARSSAVLRSEFPSLRSRLPSLWTNAYLVTTVGHGAPSSMIHRYIAQQPTR